MKSGQKLFAAVTALTVLLLVGTTAFAGNDRDDDRDRGSSSWGRDDDRNDSDDDRNDRDDDRNDRDRDRDDDDRDRNGRGSKDHDWDRDDRKVFICHRTSSSKNPYVLIHVSSSAKQSHYDHGDPQRYSEYGDGKCRPSTSPPVPTVDLTVTPGTVTVDLPATLAWTSTNAASCTLGNGTLGASGSSTVTYAVPGTYTIAITCTGAGGTASASVQLNVIGLPPVQLAACSRLDATDAATQYNWAVDYYPTTGQFSGPGSGGVGAISGVITPAGDIMEAGKTVTFTVDELTGASATPSTIANHGPGAPSIPHAVFKASMTIAGSSRLVDLAFTTNAQCYLPVPR